ncbi:hypothetical protein J3R82DRAFT_7648 [Butyriboletus roseoflavus]|nr:hypothetical protein J3R82DRAFT_7648 [Butyriboletus roseoflavus]
MSADKTESSSRPAFGTSPLSSPRFQPSVHQIPSPGNENQRSPRYEPFILKFWFVGGVALSMIFLGIALQVALYISDTRNGFAVPSKNVFSFVSTQFLTSFFPTLFIVPLAYFWSVVDWMLRWYQPYVTLSEGKASAPRSILLDYVSLHRLAVLYNSLTHRHYLIYVSTLIGLSATLLQPLAGSLLQVRDVPQTSDATALVTRTVSLSPAIDDLDAFFASTGFALASVYDNLVDPPFVNGVWTAAQFQAPPGSYLNGTLAINTTAIQTKVNCVSPASLNVTSANGSYVASATFPGGCFASNAFNPGNGTEQYNVINASSCASPGLDIVFQPVVFWFYLNTSSPQVASVYCNPTMNVFTVGTSMDLSNSSLGPCTILEPEEGTNNVTGSPQNGRPYNGVVFNQSVNFNIFSRAQAINFGIPDAIYRYATKQPGGPLSVFQNEYGFLNATKAIYTQHLAVSAEVNYFLASNTTVPAQLTSQIPRLFVEALPAYVLSALVIIIGIVGFVVHYLHRRARRKLWLTSPPGSIAAIVSLTSRSGFGALLLPYDDEGQMQHRLAGLTFGLDPRTGAIIAEEDFGAAECADRVALLGRRRPYRNPTFLVDGDSVLPETPPLKGWDNTL